MHSEFETNLGHLRPFSSKEREKGRGRKEGGQSTDIILNSVCVFTDLFRVTVIKASTHWALSGHQAVFTVC